MGLGAHLLELRKRIVISALAIVVAMVGGWFLSDLVWDFLRLPVIEIAAEYNRRAQITFSDVTSSFDLKLRISFFIAVLIAAPIWLLQVWLFFAPGLKRKEKLFAVGFMVSAIPLFAAGCYVAWMVLPNIVRILSVFSSSQDALLLDARNYLDFATKLIFAIGVGFVLPVFIVMLNMMGILSAKSIWRGWRVAVLLVVLFTAAVTPAADVISMFLLAIPMILLYFIAGLIALRHDKHLEKKQAAEFAPYADADSRDSAA